MGGTEISAMGFGGSPDLVSADATCSTILSCCCSVAAGRDGRLLLDLLVLDVPGERPLGVSDDSSSLKRFSD